MKRSFETRKKGNRIPDLVSLSISPISTYTSWQQVESSTIPPLLPLSLSFAKNNRLSPRTFHFHIISTQGRNIKNTRHKIITNRTSGTDLSNIVTTNRISFFLRVPACLEIISLELDESSSPVRFAFGPFAIGNGLNFPVVCGNAFH